MKQKTVKCIWVSKTCRKLFHNSDKKNPFTLHISIFRHQNKVHFWFITKCSFPLTFLITSSRFIKLFSKKRGKNSTPTILNWVIYHRITIVTRGCWFNKIDNLLHTYSISLLKIRVRVVMLNATFNNISVI